MSEIPHNLFRKYNPKTDKLLKYHMKDLKSSYLFLEKEVFPYFYSYVYGKNDFIKFSTDRRDFMHLCGIKYQIKNSRAHFLQDLKNDSIDLNRIKIHSDGTTLEKLEVITALPYLFTSIKVKVTKDMQISYSFEYDGFVSTKSKIIAIGLKHTSSDLFVSKTLLNLHSMKKELDGQSIHLLLRQNKTTKNIEIVDTDQKISRIAILN